MGDKVENIFEEALEKVNQKIEDQFRLRKQEALKKEALEDEEVDQTKKVVAPVEDPSIQYSYDLYIELLGMINTLMLLMSKGKIGPVLNKEISKMINKLMDTRKYYTTKNVNVDGKNRSKMLSTKRKMDTLLNTQILPLLSDRDRTKILRYQSKLNK
jgi:hypothetical protein